MQPVTDWRERAIELFPDIPTIADLITDVNFSPLTVWNEFYLALLYCYDEQPINDARIRRIYEFAEWCIDQPGTEDTETDVSNAVAVAFIENLPLDDRVWEDLHRWFSLERFNGYANLFRYHLTESQLKGFSARFENKKGGRSSAS
jgi:hypothetical protein